MSLGLEISSVRPFAEKSFLFLPLKWYFKHKENLKLQELLLKILFYYCVNLFPWWAWKNIFWRSSGLKSRRVAPKFLHQWWAVVAVASHAWVMKLARGVSVFRTPIRPLTGISKMIRWTRKLLSAKFGENWLKTAPVGRNSEIFSSDAQLWPT